MAQTPPTGAGDRDPTDDPATLVDPIPVLAALVPAVGEELMPSSGR